MRQIIPVLAALAIISSTHAATVPQPDNLVLWYKMDDGSGSIVRDHSPSHADGKLSGGKWSREGLVFDGRTQVVVGAPERMKFRKNFTLSTRVRTAKEAFGLVIGSADAGGLVVSLYSVKLATWGRDWIPHPWLPDDQWCHIAVTVDDQSYARLYINGFEKANSPVQPFPVVPDNWMIGGWSMGEWFVGSLGDVMVWDTALSVDEVKALAGSFGLDGPVKVAGDDPAPLSRTPKSVREMSKRIGGLALELSNLPRYPFRAMMGGDRFDQALRARTHKKRAEIEKWLADQIPYFDCPDDRWTRCWYYRWLLVRINYQEEDGVPGFFEGKRGAYARHITYSAPHIMDEVRWLKDGRYAFGQAEILGKRREPNGRRFGGYTHWIAQTLWNAYLVHPDKKELARLLPAWAEDTECAFPDKLATDRPLRDYLLNPPNHWATGMEWQPAWFYFDNYDRSKETNLYRPDYTAYYYANARSVAQMYRVLGEADKASRFDALAGKIKEALNTLMWDSRTGYFYSVKTGTDDRKAMVKEIVGVYPFAFGAADEKCVRAFESLLDPEEFWGPWLVTSCTMKCPMYTPKVQLCNWNGPVWPHANSIVAQAMAQGIRTYMSPVVTPAKIWELLDSFTSLHYDDKGAWKQPNLREEGNVDDGTTYGCPDYFHSTYNDLIVTLVGGLVPRDDDVIELYPVVEAPWDHFRLDRVPYKGHMLSIVWDDRPDGKRYEGVPKGYSLYVDGRLMKTLPSLRRMAVRLPN